MLVANEADADARDDDGWSPLHRAVYARNRAVAELLLGSGAELDVFAGSALCKLGPVSELIREDPALARATQANGWTALHWAVAGGRRAVAELLISHGADVNAKGTQGETPLNVAISVNAGQSASLPISRGASVNAKDSQG